MTTNPIQLIYAGGTFGSYGKPLAPLASHELLPNLLKHLSTQNLINTNQLNILENTCVKDSSQLTPADLIHFYQLILAKYQQGSRQFVLITGTDTLSYLGAFLAEAFAGSDICIVLTASMKPLFDSEVTARFEVDKNSDAWGNITQSIQFANQSKSGVFTCLSGDTWLSQSVQKIDSHALLAFTGDANLNNLSYPTNSYVDTLTQAEKSDWLAQHHNLTSVINHNLNKAQVAVVYAVPNNPQMLSTQVTAILDDTNPSAVIIMGFGAGNIPQSKQLANLFEHKANAGHLIVATTQCPFGGVSSAYAAGSWQYDHQVLSGGMLTVPAIYARLLWLLLTTNVDNRRKQWLELLK